MTLAGLERGRRLVRGALWPTPRQAAAPCAGARPHGGLLGFPLLALLRVIALGPAGMPHRCGGPLHKRGAPHLRALETPVDPGRLAAAFGAGREPGLWWQSGVGRRPGALCPAGAEETRRADGTGPTRDVGVDVGWYWSCLPQVCRTPVHPGRSVPMKRSSVASRLRAVAEA
jgi:hypothetical protein